MVPYAIHETLLSTTPMQMGSGSESELFSSITVRNATSGERLSQRSRKE